MATKKGAGGEPQEYDTSTGQYGSGKTFRQNTPYHEISKTLDGKSEHSNSFVSGGISGALDRNSRRAQRHAVRYYRSLRKRKDDVVKVAAASGYPKSVIKRIKFYLFIDEHNLGDEIAPFYPDYDIAQSWQRLTEGKPKPHDILLIKHEAMEMSLVGRGFSQREAHDITNKRYNYQEATDLFHEEYEKTRKRRKRRKRRTW